MKAGCLRADDLATTFLLLGRYGDIINSLPILKFVSDSLGQPVRLIVSEQFVKVLEGVSYVNPVPVPFHPWNGMAKARQWAESRYPGFVNLQPSCSDWTVEKKTLHFDLEAYAERGLLNMRGDLPLLFDKRDTGREARLIERIRGDNPNPILLINFTAVSNRFNDGKFVLDALTQWKEKLNIVNVDDVRDAPIFDLIALMEVAIGMITVDTATLHLAPATDIKFVLLYSDSVPSWSSSSMKRGCVLAVPHSKVRKMMINIHEAIGNMLNPEQPASTILSLPQVTMVAIDSFKPKRTISAMNKNAMLVAFGAAALVTCQEYAAFPCEFTVIPALPSDARIERERYLITRITEAFSTTHCLHVEWDSGIRNPKAWQDSWLQYDFIGAPWPPGMTVEGYPRITRDTCVGNTGFCLFSKRFADALATVQKPTEWQVGHACDIYLATVLRPVLERMGLKFAPPPVAARFSCENRTYTDQFGWHGRGTAAINRFRLET